MRVAVYPGSFDPVTLGHLDIIQRTSKMFDRVIIGVLNNTVPKSPLFTAEERVELLKEVTSGSAQRGGAVLSRALLIDFVRQESTREGDRARTAGDHGF